MYAVYNGVEAAGTIVSAESVEIAFTDGIPLASTDMDVVIEFREDTNPVTGIIAAGT